MENRMNMQEIQPAAYKAMLGLEQFLATTKLSKTLKELIKIRASQINGCAFCIDMHTRDALAHGETTQRIFLLNAWKETSFFTEEEKTVLAITEEVTLINQQGLTNTTYEKALRFFTREIIAEIIMAIVTINSWNRIVISTRLPVPGQPQ